MAYIDEPGMCLGRVGCARPSGRSEGWGSWSYGETLGCRGAKCASSGRLLQVSSHAGNCSRALVLYFLLYNWLIQSRRGRSREAEECRGVATRRVSGFRGPWPRGKVLDTPMLNDASSLSGCRLLLGGLLGVWVWVSPHLGACRHDGDLRRAVPRVRRDRHVLRLRHQVEGGVQGVDSAGHGELVRPHHPHARDARVAHRRVHGRGDEGRGEGDGRAAPAAAHLQYNSFGVSKGLLIRVS
jgi:hypothetical protein